MNTGPHEVRLDGAALVAGRASESRFDPGPPPPATPDQESLAAWGFRDTQFTIGPTGNVTLTGGRYALAGLELPDLIPWINRTLGTEVRADDIHEPPRSPAPPPEPRLHHAFLADLRRHLGGGDEAMTTDPRIRLRHGHGHTLEEIYAVRYGQVQRIPDLVVYPDGEEEVAAVVEAATRHDVCLVPFGGGTNVSDALRCPPDEERMIVSVDLGRMRRIRWIDPVNLMACIEAGAVGRHIQEQLAEYGFTLGHEPDSVEFSTLGGWIATHASGMKKNRYGNIEDLVLDVHVVTPKGPVARSAVAPRESVGADPRRWILGSEGTMGIITHAVVKIFPLPEVQKYDALLFPDFERGVAFMYDLARSPGVVPASVRLVDNLQFQLSQTLKPKAEGWKASKRKVEKWIVTKVKGFDPGKMCACTLLYEGGRDEVAAQEATVLQLAKRHGAMRAGSENGQKGYQLTFGIAYLRDWVMKHWILGESFETSVPWTQALALCENVKSRLHQEYAARNLPGRPFVTCRVTQLYQTGVCIYFYFGFPHKGVEDPAHVYGELERCARDEILRSGGSLSHHHGVGKIRRGFLPRIMSPATLAWAAEVKRSVDPGNVFGIANQNLQAGSGVPQA